MSVFFSCTFNTTGIDPGNDIFSFNQAEFLIEISEDELLVSMLKMIGQVSKLSDQQIQNIDEARILEIASPLQKVRTNFARFDEVSLEKLSGPFEAFVQAVDTMTLVSYSHWSEKLQQLISESSVITPADLAYSYQEIKNLFISFNSNPRTYTSWCKLLFNVTSEGHVILTRGDSFAVANLFCPGNTTFLAEPGIHTGQNIPYSKSGNTWIGIGAGGGEHIKVIDNKMYSAPIINVSNVAFYSMLEPVTQPQPCGNHEFRGNVANWTYYTNITGELKQFPNFAWAAVNNSQEINTDIYCGLWIHEIRDSSRVSKDLLMGPEIWDSW